MKAKPAENLLDRIREVVRSELENRRQPLTQDALIVGIRWALPETARHSDETIRRRLKESVSQLRAEGLPVASDAQGYRIVRTPEDRAAGHRFLVRQLSAIARTLRAYDASGADRLEQLVFDLEPGGTP